MQSEKESRKQPSLVEYIVRESQNGPKGRELHLSTLADRSNRVIVPAQLFHDVVVPGTRIIVPGNLPLIEHFTKDHPTFNAGFAMKKGDIIQLPVKGTTLQKPRFVGDDVIAKNIFYSGLNMSIKTFVRGVNGSKGQFDARITGIANKMHQGYFISAEKIGDDMPRVNYGSDMQSQTSPTIYIGFLPFKVEDLSSQSARFTRYSMLNEQGIISQRKRADNFPHTAIKSFPESLVLEEKGDKYRVLSLEGDALLHEAGWYNADKMNDYLSERIQAMQNRPSMMFTNFSQKNVGNILHGIKCKQIPLESRLN